MTADEVGVVVEANRLARPLDGTKHVATNAACRKPRHEVVHHLLHPTSDGVKFTNLENLQLGHVSNLLFVLTFAPCDLPVEATF